jgi:hypothetical protein
MSASRTATRSWSRKPHFDSVLEADEAAERGGFGGAAEEKVEGQGTRGSRGAMCSVFCRRQTPRGVASPLGEDDLVGLKGQWVRFGPVRLNTFFFLFPSFL